MSARTPIIIIVVGDFTQKKSAQAKDEAKKWKRKQHTLKWATTTTTTTNSDFWRRAYTLAIAWKWFKLFTKINYGYIICCCCCALVGPLFIHSFWVCYFISFVCLFWWIRWVFGVFRNCSQSIWYVLVRHYILMCLCACVFVYVRRWGDDCTRQEKYIEKNCIFNLVSKVIKKGSETLPEATAAAWKW